MSNKAHAQLRRSQVITIWGPGSLLDLPRHSVVMAGLETWPTRDLEPVLEPRLAAKLEQMTEVKNPQLFSPPAADSGKSHGKLKAIAAYRFPQWFLTQEPAKDSNGDQMGLPSSTVDRPRLLVHRRSLDEKLRFEGRQVVPTRFVSACPRGHVDDVDWRTFVHRGESECRKALSLSESGTGGDLKDLWVRCGCGASRTMLEATELDQRPLGTCKGKRPWLGDYARESCGQPARLLIRTGSNAYFPQVVSVLSLPDLGSETEAVVREAWDKLQNVENQGELAFVKKDQQMAEKLAPFSDQEILDAIESIRSGGNIDRPVKLVELDAILQAKVGFGDDVPLNEDFHARRLPESAWRNSEVSKGIANVVQLHRLREVLALAGFTRFEAETADIQGEYPSDVERASLAIEPSWFPAVENRGEGVFLQLNGDAVQAWLERDAVKRRIEDLATGHGRWREERKSKRDFPGGPYILLHTLSHLLIQSFALRCGYPASSIRERIYSDPEGGRYGILLFTGSPDAEGTLGGLVQQARHIESHLAHALRRGALCSSDPICAQHTPSSSLEERWLQGASCHRCSLVAETSCEMRNDYLDRALVTPIIGVEDAAFFGPRE